MYGGCALSTELNEVPPKAAADSRRGAGGMLRSRRCPGVGRWGCGSPLVPWAVWGPLAPELHGALERPLAPGRHRSATDMGGARAWRHPLLPSCASGPDGCGAVGAWQDMRAVHDSRGACSEKGPFAARSSRSVFPDGCLQGFSDAWRAYLATNRRFSRPRPLRERMRRKNCHG